VFLNNRYYDPTLGNFISVDPLVGKTGTPYLYGAGNPSTLSDPSGLAACSDDNQCPWSSWLESCAPECGYHYDPPKPLSREEIEALYIPSPNVYVPGYDGESPTFTGDPRNWCHIGSTGSMGGDCGAPPASAEYSSDSQVEAVLDYLSTYGGAASDGAAGAAEAATVSVAGYVTTRGTTVLSYTRYRAGLADFGNGIAPAGKLVVGTRWVGRAFVALQAGVTAFDSWRATEGHSTLYRLSYTTVKTVVTTSGAVAGATAGASWGATGGAAVGGPVGAVVGGFVGGVAGGLFGWWAADEVTDVVWNFTYEQVT